MENLQYEKINRKAAFAWMYSSLVSWGVYSLIICSIMFVINGGIQEIGQKIAGENTTVNMVFIYKWEIGIAVVFALILIFNVFIYPFFESRQWLYRITEEQIVYIEGVYKRTRTIIPVSKIQHIDIEQNLVFKKYGLSSIVIYTAGNKHEIPALPTSVAEVIMQNLLNKIKDKGEVLNG